MSKPLTTKNEFESRNVLFLWLEHLLKIVMGLLKNILSWWLGVTRYLMHDA
jgi:hypothetical protein